MKKLLIGLLLLSVMIIGSVFGETTFTDVESDIWYFGWVNDLVDENITSGYPDGTFKPESQLKRIELLSFTMKALGYDLPVAEGYWGQNIINKAVTLKIINEDDLMATNPDDVVTREETAYVIYNAYLLNHDVFDEETETKARLSISDIESVNQKYQQGVIGLFSEGLVTGYDDSSFRANNPLTRAEAAVFISRLKLPERRATVDFRISVFEYEVEGRPSLNFIDYYTKEHQDIYNIMMLVDAYENGDVENGFAYLMKSRDGLHNAINLYPNFEEYNTLSDAVKTDTAALQRVIWFKTWALILRHKPLDATYADWIEIHGFNRPEREKLQERVIMKIFDYLFEDESEFVWKKFLDVRSEKISQVDGFEYKGKHNGRDVRINQSSTGFGIYITRKTDVKPIIISDYREE